MRFSARGLLCAALGSLLCAASASPEPQGPWRVERPIGFDGTLSVLTYNVKGLPWPLARGRPAAMRAISSRLRDLRRLGRAPHVVVLQEAFTADARAIGREAGYRYVLDGPSASDVNDAPLTEDDRRFVDGASWSAGETLGKLYGSGLVLLSDYPAIAVRRMVYPSFACAGFDCLSNKGAMLVSLRIPGVPSPVDIVTTHLNSRHSSGVSDDRSLYAYLRQTELLSAFINAEHDPSRPLIVAGDFNLGSAMPRWLGIRAQIATWRGGGVFHNSLSDVVRVARDRGIPLPSQIRDILRRGADWQFFASGAQARLRTLAVRVPFGREPTGGMLSDHIGYISLFRLDNPLALMSVANGNASRKTARLARQDGATETRTRSTS